VAQPFKTRWSGVGTGGTLALDFVNTLDWRGRPVPVELLHEYADLLRWGWSAGAIDPGETQALLEWSARHPRVAQRVLESAIETREAMASAFQAVARGHAVPPAPLARIESACREAWAARVLEPSGGAAGWTWRQGPPVPERPFWAAALDAERLLTAGETRRVRECGDSQCAWLFLDISRNRSRRWCSMEGCGNRNKARRYQQRAARRG
jgi:predicted RNA-binding Zn ribbon-like protein